MKKYSIRMIILLSVIISILASCAEQKKEEFSFIIASDQRQHATQAYRTNKYTLGGFEAMKEIGQGSFIIINGDLDPPQATRELLDIVLGKDYPWYIVVGNHDAEKEENMEYLRNTPKGDGTHTINKGPSGCEETTYSFDRFDAHFVVLNLYYDGKSDRTLDGIVVPELLEWLENDLKQNDKKIIFVFGHEPIIPILDMDNGTVRHLGDAMDKYPDNTLKFLRMMLKYKVTAFFSGHTHCTSYGNVNGLWLINSGHIYGQESEFTPERLLVYLKREIPNYNNKLIEVTKHLSAVSESNMKEFKKLVFNLGYGIGEDYKNLSNEETIKRVNEFYTNCLKDESEIERYTKLFLEKTEWRKSTFLRITMNPEAPLLEIYRDKDYTGNYELKYSLSLTK